ncbi:DUF2268 domain-containing protein [Niabella pedocola]|uniref:DUF2268 domain-containing protein n=1 Tax=Niabella pedocola TaxID=1752077 RepID=A0ABS8PKH4_9BACT|nr:DUF2268 domain-containing putative Zn-dependent protease [Niabella pedocola]MCD2421501.1 DUF2268 domain-containing protein [Niabella pedocola]
MEASLRRISFFFLLLIHCYGMAQTTASLRSEEAAADSLFRLKKYSKAAAAYATAIDLADFKIKKAGLYYSLANAWALAGDKDNAFNALKQAINLGYDDKAHIENDKDLLMLHQQSGWASLLAGVPNASLLNDDPEKTAFRTDDIHRFWRAYDAALLDTANYARIFRLHYFDSASAGMEDYMAYKVNSIDDFIAHIRSAPVFYHSIRSATFQSDAFKQDFLASFKKLKALYPIAKFPDVYFVMGTFTSAGTVTRKGLLIGINQVSKTDSTYTGELSDRLKTRMNNISYLPNIIAHEAIHFQQDGMNSDDTTTLRSVIVEGMADFIGELISGATANPVLFSWAKGKEKAIWARFKKDMYQSRYSNWIANSKTSSPDNPPDQGYWIGYQICKSYYEKARDKKRAIYDMLHIRDYRQFLKQSGWEQKLAGM